jgi:hypothetical protein
MKYDKIRHLKLLKQAESLKKKGMSFYKEDRDKYSKLLKYEIRLAYQKYWENRRNYITFYIVFPDLLHNYIVKYIRSTKIE